MKAFPSNGFYEKTGGGEQPQKINPVKELTDEEIKAVYGEYFDVKNFDWLQLQCIQAILRKASEK